jgi:prepilin-type N-terminal cleavage/methylation domain-containing protein
MNNLRRLLRDDRGFNLIELMIVIAIIGLLIAVGAIGWQVMIRSGNETAAQQTLDRLRMFQAQYAGKNHGKFAKFDELVRTAGLDESFNSEKPVVNGYVFTLTVTDPTPSQPAFYSINADPQVAEGPTATGTNHFYTDSTLGTIKHNDKDVAKATDPSI